MWNVCQEEDLQLWWKNKFKTFLTGKCPIYLNINLLYEFKKNMLRLRFS